jgi:hypothetical protein
MTVWLLEHLEYALNQSFGWPFELNKSRAVLISLQREPNRLQVQLTGRIACSPCQRLYEFLISLSVLSRITCLTALKLPKVLVLLLILRN